MKIREVAKIVNGEVLCCEHLLDNEVYSACGSDMMSNVLAFVKDQGCLLTGLCNPQVIRTAEMMDIKCVVLVRGKCPDEAMTKLAAAHDIVLIRSNERMFEACGKLYEAGLNR
jgi:predicted transcriptional regulator